MQGSEQSRRAGAELTHRLGQHRLNRRRFVAGSAATVLASLSATLMTGGATAAPAARASGDRLVIGLIQEPGQMNQFFANQSGSFLSVIAVEPLFAPNAAGDYQPILAAEVPTIENGGISQDSLTITYKLRDGLTWSDGEPFTAEDIKFTFAVYRDPGSTPVGVPSTYALIKEVEAVDATTAKVTMSAVNPGYLDLWQYVLPKHKFSSTTVTQKDDQARLPLGTGPFVFKEWKTGDQITLDKNPHYREQGKPLFDGVTIKVTPEKEAAIASFVAGDLDYLYFIVTGDLETLTKAEKDDKGVHVDLGQGGASVEWLWLNLGKDGDPAKPHPVLGDPAIREAMDYAIDRQAIIDQILGGFGSLTGSFIYAGWAAVEQPVTPYDPKKAKEVLDAAGWKPGDGGVREKNGVKASLRYQCIAGDQTRELYQQLVQQNFKDVGIELKIQNVPSNTIFGSYQEGGLLARGNYDIVMSRAGYAADPADWVSLFTTDQIPSKEHPNRFTYSFYSNPEFDALIKEAAATLDKEKRKAAYAKAVEIFARDRPALPLYRSAKGDAWRDRLSGINTDVFDPRGALYSIGSWTAKKA